VSGAAFGSEAPARAAPAIPVSVNGEERTVATGCSLVELLGILGLDPRAVAVERNLEIVPRAELPNVVLAAGDRLEIVRFVQGG
jgi:thiamine biosynthesis protein ThiS